MRKGVCKECQASGVWVNRATLKGAALGEFCGDCWPYLNHDETPRRLACVASLADGDGSRYAESFGNAVRIVEDSRGGT